MDHVVGRAQPRLMMIVVHKMADGAPPNQTIVPRKNVSSVIKKNDDDGGHAKVGGGAHR